MPTVKRSQSKSPAAAHHKNRLKASPSAPEQLNLCTVAQCSHCAEWAHDTSCLLLCINVVSQWIEYTLMPTRVGRSCKYCMSYVCKLLTINPHTSLTSLSPHAELPVPDLVFLFFEGAQLCVYICCIYSRISMRCISRRECLWGKKTEGDTELMLLTAVFFMHVALSGSIKSTAHLVGSLERKGQRVSKLFS